jgi:hypothetical protein
MIDTKFPILIARVVQATIDSITELLEGTQSSLPIHYYHSLTGDAADMIVIDGAPDSKFLYYLLKLIFLLLSMPFHLLCLIFSAISHWGE